MAAGAGERAKVHVVESRNPLDNRDTNKHIIPPYVGNLEDCSDEAAASYKVLTLKQMVRTFVHFCWLKVGTSKGCRAPAYRPTLVLTPVL